MLAFLDNGSWVKWTNQLRPYNGSELYRIPSNAEEVYSDEELFSFGLYRVVEETIPENKRVTSWSLVERNEKPFKECVYTDILPEPLKDLGRPAFLFMLYKIGFSESTIETLIGSLPESTPEERDEKLLAQIVFKNQQNFHRDNALLNKLAGLANLSDEVIDSAWKEAEKVTW